MNPSQSISSLVFRDVPLAGVTRANVSKWLKAVKAKVGPEKAQALTKPFLLLSSLMRGLMKPLFSCSVTSVRKPACQFNGLVKSKSRRSFKFWLPLQAWLTD